MLISLFTPHSHLGWLWAQLMQPVNMMEYNSVPFCPYLCSIVKYMYHRLWIPSSPSNPFIDVQWSLLLAIGNLFHLLKDPLNIPTQELKTTIQTINNFTIPVVFHLFSTVASHSDHRSSSFGSSLPSTFSRLQSLQQDFSNTQQEITTKELDGTKPSTFFHI